MPAPAVTYLTKTILRNAHAAELASAGAGLTFLETLNSQLGAVLLAGGQKMISAATASKSFGFTDGWSTDMFAASLNEAFATWASMTTAEVLAFINARQVQVTRAFYC